MGYSIKRTGRSGAEHRWWQKKIKEHYEARGYDSFIEYYIGKRSVDVYSVKGDEKIATEVALMRGMKIDLSCLPEHVRAVVRTYLRGILDRFRERIISIVLYGSFGRGDYGAESDVDLLLVIDEHEWSEDLGVEEAERLTYKIWKLKGEYHKVTPYP